MLDATQELTIIRMPRHLDAAGAEQLADQFNQKIQPYSGVILDLSQTHIVELDAAQVLIQGLTIAKQRSAKLSLMGVQSHIAAILSATGVLQHFRKLEAA
ncbi:STAS domain-containing protein [Alkalinema pantanalense CENA528]|uniref:STAS domain-containing protein n=1 Tax=Alkalinema pantanalense TaxID=1620705 RepID=UPI003D6EE656